MTPTIDYGDSLRLGIIIPSGNVVAEPQIRAMVPPGVGALFTRLALRGSSDAELQRMTEGVEEAATLLADARVGRVIFHCTAVTTASPQAGPAIRQRIESATGTPALVTSDALIEAFRALSARRIVLLTPYIARVHQREIDFCTHLGLEVVHDDALGIETNEEMARLTPDDLARWALRHRHEGADAYFMSCTALRSADCIAFLEQHLHCPVITSNQVIVWHALRDCGHLPAAPQWGCLMTI